MDNSLRNEVLGLLSSLSSTGNEQLFAVDCSGSYATLFLQTS